MSLEGFAPAEKSDLVGVIPNSGLVGVTVANSTDQEKKIRREIANSNERRRMQSINAGFQNLRTLLPQHEGEKLSKAAILQQTAEYIYSLEQEKTRLLAQNCQLKRLLSLSQQHLDNLQEPDATATTLHKGRKRAGKPDIEVEKAVEIKVAATTLTTQVDVPSRLTAPMPEAVVATLRGSIDAPLPTATTVVEAPKSVVTVPPPVAAVLSKLTPNQPLPAAPSAITVIQTTTSSRVPTVVPASALPEQVATNLATVVAPVVSPATRSEVVVTTTRQPTVQIVAAEEEVTSEPAMKSENGATYGGSKQNLDSIVEAIRHLEGDHLFSGSSTTAQRVSHPPRSSSP